jgi:hypothetical protein
LIVEDGWAGHRAMKKYLIIVEETETGYSAYSPDVPVADPREKRKQTWSETSRKRLSSTSKAYGKKGTKSPSRAATLHTST